MVVGTLFTQKFTVGFSIILKKLRGFTVCADAVKQRFIDI